MTSGCVRASGVLVLAVWQVEEDFQAFEEAFDTTTATVAYYRKLYPFILIVTVA